MYPIDNAASSSRTIFINPNFNKPPPTHINPKFLLAQINPTIHVNPNFLAKKTLSTDLLNDQPIPAISQEQKVEPAKNQLLQQNATVSKTTAPLLPNKIISKSRTKIVRVPMPIAATETQNTTNLAKKISPPACSNTPGMIKIGLRKLIRTTTTPVEAKPPIVKSLQAKYKIDRRILSSSMPIRKRKTSFTGRYALRRSSDTLSIKVISKFMKRNTDALGFTKKPFKVTSLASKNQQLLNINGVLYKSTRNKLERKDTSTSTNVSPTNATAIKKPNRERAIFVRGTKYLLDKSGFNLTRVPTTKLSSNSQGKSLRRIDIGGLTYVANSKNVLVRTDTHLTRNHVSNAKQKSIQLLSRRFVKTNIPCLIFQRVGKCAAFERGKCMKVHDKLHVAICPRFLRGECVNSSCLLSHNISLSKMPVCKFFLQGCCVREDCPYLHKKLSAKADICIEFLKGFCKQAEKCNKRHEFVCPDLETKGTCNKVKCQYCRKHQLSLNNKKSTSSSEKSKNPPIEEKPSLSMESVVTQEQTLDVPARYFAQTSRSSALARESTALLGEIDKVTDSLNKIVEGDDDDAEDDCENEEEVISASSVPRRTRPQLGELPAFIPFS